VAPDSDLLRAVLDASPDGVAALEAVRDPQSNEVVDFRWIVVNRSAAAWLGREEEDLIGARLLDIDPALAQDGRLERFVRVVQTQRTVCFKRRIAHPVTGSAHTIRLRVSPLEDGVVVTATDVTASTAGGDAPPAENARQATRDELTGVATSWAIEQMLQTELARSDRYRRPLAVLMIDVDHFARINEAHGTDAGDRALQILTRVLTASLRTTDHVGRVGGEEFLVVLPETPLDGAFDLAERIRQRVSTIVVRLPGGTTRLTVSLGVAGHGPGETRDSLLARAEGALVAAKRGGRDRVELAPAA